MRLKKKKLGPAPDVREGRKEMALVRAMAVEEREKEDTPPLV